MVVFFGKENNKDKLYRVKFGGLQEICDGLIRFVIDNDSTYWYVYIGTLCKCFRGFISATDIIVFSWGMLKFSTSETTSACMVASRA